jgi:hypothetical protein
VSVKFKYLTHEYYAWIIASILLIAVVLTIFFYLRGEDWKILLTIIGGLFSFMYFIQKQQLEEAQLFKELFVEFNSRYDDMNEELNRIKEIKDKAQLNLADLNVLYDYFNLCGEEYLFYRKGYIYPEVWTAWCNGMIDYFKCAIVNEMWKDENPKSYYGLTLDKIKKSSSKKVDE